MLCEQLGLFDAPPPPTPAADAVQMADGAAMARLAELCAVAVHGSPCGWSMRQMWRAAEPWQEMADAARASNAMAAKLSRRKTMTDAQKMAALDAAEPFAVYVFRRRRATHTILSAVEGTPLTLADATESAEGIAALCDTPPEVVVRYMLTGEVTR